MRISTYEDHLVYGSLGAGCSTQKWTSEGELWINEWSRAKVYMTLALEQNLPEYSNVYG